MKKHFFLFAFVLLAGTSMVLGQSNYSVSTLLPEGTNLFDDGLTIDENGTLYASYWGVWQAAAGRHIYRIRPNGTMDTLAEGMHRPNGLHYSEGKVYVANSYGNYISVVDTLDGSSVQLLNVSNPSNVLKLKGLDSVLIVSYTGRKLYGYSSANGLSIISNSTKLQGPVGLALDSTGSLYVSNFDNGKILKLNDEHEFDEVADITGGTGFITINGADMYATNHVTKKVYKVSLIDSSVSVIAGSGEAVVKDGMNDSASFRSPNGIVTTPSGDSIYISEFQGKALRLMERLAIDTSLSNAPFYSLTSLDVFPQPSTNRCQIELETNHPIASIRISDSLGAAMDCSWNQTARLIDVDVSALPSGHYVLSIAFKSGEIQTKKIVVSR